MPASQASRPSSVEATTSVGAPASVAQFARFLALADVEIPPSYRQRRSPRLRVLFLADDKHAANVVLDHVGGIAGLSAHDVRVVNPIHDSVDAAIYGPRFDVILIHYSIFILGDYFLPPPWRDYIQRDSRPKIQIIQDEHRHIERMKSAMANLGICGVLSSLSVENLAKVYGGPLLPRTSFFSCLPGYISPAAHGTSTPRIADRPLDVVYRGRDLPFKLGRLAQEKELIGRNMKAIALAHGLSVDIEWLEGKRIYGEDWLKFLMSGRATLGVEGGATIFDFNDDLDRQIDEYRASHPGAGFEELWQVILAPYEGNVVHATITPKIFESIGLRTALILHPGHYRGVLEPGRHYVVLKPDGSNAADVVAKIRDTSYLQNLVDRTYDDIMHRPALQMSFYVNRLDRIMLGAWAQRRTEIGRSRAFFDDVRNTLTPIVESMNRMIVKSTTLIVKSTTFIRSAPHLFVSSYFKEDGIVRSSIRFARKTLFPRRRD
jgi:hypothetical protein